MASAGLFLPLNRPVIWGLGGRRCGRGADHVGNVSCGGGAAAPSLSWLGPFLFKARMLAGRAVIPLTFTLPILSALHEPSSLRRATSLLTRLAAGRTRCDRHDAHTSICPCCARSRL
jgi:hypothetical protein